MDPTPALIQGSAVLGIIGLTLTWYGGMSKYAGFYDRPRPAAGLLGDPGRRRRRMTPISVPSNLNTGSSPVVQRRMFDSTCSNTSSSSQSSLPCSTSCSDVRASGRVGRSPRADGHWEQRSAP